MNEELVDVICNDNQNRYCGIKLDEVTCDGYHYNKSIGVFTHFHEDHIRAVHDCIGSYDVLIAHPITFEGIAALKPGLRYREQWTPQDFDTEYKKDDTSIRLLKANHIPGSSQVYVNSSNKSMLYSGDFNYPDMQIKQSDYLVIDATHGDLWFDGKTDRKSVKNRLYEDIIDKIDACSNIVIQTSTGTLQEIVRHFEIRYGHKMDSDISFVMDEKQKNVLFNIYKDEKSEFRDIIDYDSDDFWKLIRKNKKCIIFTNKKMFEEDLGPFYNIIIDRYRFEKSSAPIMPFEGGCRYNLAAHASIDNLYSYIEAVKPKHVITDYSRSSFAKQLSKMIQQKFPEITATYRPTWARSS